MSSTFGPERKERRQSRRVRAPLDVALAGAGGEGAEVRALDLSAGGVHLASGRYFTPLTKVELTLVLPPFGGSGEGRVDSASIRTEGIVVRCEPEGEAGMFSLGIAFLHLAAPDRDRIESYVTWRLERSLIESAGP